MDPTPAGPPALLLDWLLAHVFTPLDVHHARFWASARIRPTRLWFTCQPWRRSSLVIRGRP